MTTLTQIQKEDLRRAVREVLAVVPQSAFPASVVLRRVARLQALDFAPADDDVAAALALLASLGQAKSLPAPLGATPYWQATAAGVLAHERGE